MEDGSLARQTLHRWPDMFAANFYDVETDVEYWISGPHRNGQDPRYRSIKPTVDDDTRVAYQGF